jgi:hypothetical protein
MGWPGPICRSNRLPNRIGAPCLRRSDARRAGLRTLLLIFCTLAITAITKSTAAAGTTEEFRALSTEIDGTKCYTDSVYADLDARVGAWEIEAAQLELNPAGHAEFHQKHSGGVLSDFRQMLFRQDNLNKALARLKEKKCPEAPAPQTDAPPTAAPTPPLSPPGVGAGTASKPKTAVCAACRAAAQKYLKAAADLDFALEKRTAAGLTTPSEYVDGLKAEVAKIEVELKECLKQCAPAPAPPPPKKACAACQEIVGQITEIKGKIAGQERQKKVMIDFNPKPTKAVQDAIDDFDRKIADLNAQKAKLEAALDGCKSTCAAAPITEILVSPKTLTFNQKEKGEIIWQGVMTVKSFHVNTTSGIHFIYMPLASSDTEIKTVSTGTCCDRRPGIAIIVTFDEGTVVRGPFGGTAGPDAKFAIPKGATTLKMVAVEAEWTTAEWKEHASFQSANKATLEWPVNVPLSDMGMSAPDRQAP